MTLQEAKEKGPTSMLFLGQVLETNMLKGGFWLDIKNISNFKLLMIRIALLSSTQKKKKKKDPSRKM